MTVFVYFCIFLHTFMHVNILYDTITYRGKSRLNGSYCGGAFFFHENHPLLYLELGNLEMRLWDSPSLAEPIDSPNDCNC